MSSPEAERSFSCLRQIHRWLRTTTTRERLGNLGGLWHFMALTFQLINIGETFKTKRNVQSFCFIWYIYFLIHLCFYFNKECMMIRECKQNEHNNGKIWVKREEESSLVGSYELDCWTGLLDLPLNLNCVYSMTSTQSDVPNWVTCSMLWDWRETKDVACGVLCLKDLSR